MCATDDSYQLTRERMSQVEKDSWSRSAIEIKPGGTQSKNRLGFLQITAVVQRAMKGRAHIYILHHRLTVDTIITHKTERNIRTGYAACGLMCFMGKNVFLLILFSSISV